MTKAIVLDEAASPVAIKELAELNSEFLTAIISPSWKMIQQAFTIWKIVANFLHYIICLVSFALHHSQMKRAVPMMGTALRVF
ncbi:hypothetical protein FHR23_001457 [Stakelama sediminis]|uniref:Uncharacterized protein n=1 Tax=Stakelama sediminis TaxID=463200 RepID=A0A840YYD5_9SPHN|nr:hypothetical protein [Stakelama sediminis]